MSKHSRFVFLSGVLLFVLLLSLARPMAVYAQDETPPPATEEAVVTEVPATAEAIATEEPAATEAPVTTETPVVPEELSATEAPIIASQTEETGDETDAAKELTMSEVLEAAPEDTEVVVLDESGEALPLVSEEAAGIAATVDPMWCPAGETPLNDAADGSVECRSFGTPQLLIDDMDATPALYSQNGTIYFTPDSGGAFLLNEDATGLSLASWNALRGFDLTLQGGWNGDSAAGFAVDPVVGTVFNGGDLIKVGLGNPWVGDLTIKDITINGASDTGLWVFTQGDIDLENVTSNNPGELYGAYLTTSGGDIRVANSSFNLHSSDGLRTWAVDGSITLTDVTATGNGNRGVQGQAGGSGGIRVTGGSFSNNGWDGLWVWSPEGDITLSGVTANDNGNHGASLDTCISVEGVCTGSGSININYSNFDGNNKSSNLGAGAGLYIDSSGNVSLDHVSASNNGAVPGSAGGDGAQIYDFSSLMITNSVFNNNYSNESDGDFGYGWGLWAWGGFSGSGEVTLTNVTASGNNNPVFYAGGAWIDTSGNITIDPSEFNNNTSGAGLDLGAGGNITLTDVMANDNGDEGAWLFSDGDTTIVCSNFENNGAFGVDAWQVLGTLTLDRVTFSNNGAGDYDYDGSPTITSGACVVVVPPDEPVIPDTPVIPPNLEEVFETNGGHGHDALPLHIVPVDGGEEIKLECEEYSGTKLILPNGDQVTLPCPIHDHGVLTGRMAGRLPAPLNAPFVFASALEVQVIRGGKAVDKVNQGMTIDFMIPDGMQGKDLVVLRWDAEKSQWVEVPGGTQTGDGRFLAASNLTGIYVLVTK